MLPITEMRSENHRENSNFQCSTEFEWWKFFPLLLNFTQTRLNSHNSPAGWLCDFPILPTFIQLCRHKNAIYCRSSLHPNRFSIHRTMPHSESSIFIFSFPSFRVNEHRRCDGGNWRLTSISCGNFSPLGNFSNDNNYLLVKSANN